MIFWLTLILILVLFWCKETFHGNRLWPQLIAQPNWLTFEYLQQTLNIYKLKIRNRVICKILACDARRSFVETAFGLQLWSEPEIKLWSDRIIINTKIDIFIIIVIVITIIINALSSSLLQSWSMDWARARKKNF